MLNYFINVFYVQAAIFLVASIIFTYVFFIILKSGQVLKKY
jgi:hypothetical protein